MHRHSDNTITLDKRETEIMDLYLQIMVEESMDQSDAAEHALSALPNPDPAFAQWLSGVTPETFTNVCRHCGRGIVQVNGQWINPDATGDDSVWRETCEDHDTFIAEHEPE